MKKNLLNIFAILIWLFIIFTPLQTSFAKTLKHNSQSTLQDEKELENHAKKLEKERVKNIKNNSSQKADEKLQKQLQKVELQKQKQLQKIQKKQIKAQKKQEKQDLKLQKKQQKQTLKLQNAANKQAAIDSKNQNEIQKAAVENIEQPNQTNIQTPPLPEAEKTIDNSTEINDKISAQNDLTEQNVKRSPENIAAEQTINKNKQTELDNDTKPNLNVPTASKEEPQIPVLQPVVPFKNNLEDVNSLQKNDIPKETPMDFSPQNIQNSSQEVKPEKYYSKRKLNYKDIKKNDVSINEFLQFTPQQNEKFSLFYYETVSNMQKLANQIKDKENEIAKLKSNGLDSKESYESLQRLNRQLDDLFKQHDSYYNNALAKFNSMLTKKQAVKWEILQQMGYRFFPEF